MRQAGRFAGEYPRPAQTLSRCSTSVRPLQELATEVTLQPVRRIEVDAAILLLRISLLPLAPSSIPFDFVQGEGPAFETPQRSEADLVRIRPFEPRGELP